MIFLIVILIAGILLYAVVLGASPKKARGSRVSSRRSNGGGSANPADIRPRWEAIKAASQTGASGLKNAIMDADKLLDYVLKGKGYPGETMGDRLKVASRDFSDRDGVWRAHKLRNTLAHEVGFDLVVSQANEALRDFERALRDMGAL